MSKCWNEPRPIRLLTCLLVLASGLWVGCSKEAPPSFPRGGQRRAAVPSTTPTDPQKLTTFRLKDVAATVGLTEPHREADDGRFRLIETMGGGLGWIDYDGDGRLDLFVGQGAPVPPVPGDKQWWSRLYHNESDGSFRDVTEASGVKFGRYAQGVAVGDVDGDGRDDLFVAGFGQSALYRNVDGGRFEDITAKAGVAGSGWASSCAFADLDRDGDLDLFVVRYLANTVDGKGEPTVRCNSAPGKPGYCPPSAFAPETNLLYRNNGDGTFTDVSASSNIADSRANGLGLVIADFDGDGKLDIFVASDQMPNLLFHNTGDLTFDETALASGVALSENGQTRAGMGVAVGDADGDGLLDICVTNFFEEGVTLYRNLGEGRFQVTTAASRLLVPTRGKLGFGAGFLDVDNDGWLDLFLANGHINDVSEVGMPYRMEAQLFRNAGAGRFTDISADSGDYFQRKLLGRSAAFGDFDNDGRTDIAVSHLQGPPALLRNESNAGHWLRLKLVGAGKSRSAVGARIRAEAAGVTVTRWVIGGSSYLAANDPRILLGLGSATKIDRLQVQWLSGRVNTLNDVEVGREIELREADAVAVPRGKAGF